MAGPGQSAARVLGDEVVRLPKVEIYTTDVCNNRCAYCATGWDNTENARTSLKHVPRETIRRHLEEHYARGARRVVFAGGEPTVRRDLGALVQDAREVGYLATTVFTNARVAASPIGARWLASLGVTWFQVSIQGGTAEAHDESVVARRAFGQTVEGTRRLLALGQRVKVNGVLTRHLLDTLRDFAALMIELRPEEVGLDVVRPSPAFAPGRASLRDLLPPLSNYSTALRDALLAMNAAGVTARVVSCPPCLVPGAEHLVSEEQSTSVMMLPTGDFENKLAQRRSLQVKPASCAACAHVDTCPGVFGMYAEAYGFDELKPIARRKAIEPRDASPRPLPGKPNSMRSDRVFTNLACNQNCRYCTSRSGADDPAYASTMAVQLRVEAALRGGAQELVLTGGEPALRSDLPLLVGYARARGARSIIVETNGTLIDGARAEKLKKMGLTAARVNLSGWGEALDALTRDAGGFRRAIAGLHALVDAGVAIEVSAAIVRSSLPLLAALPDRLAEELGPKLDRLRAILLRTPVDSPDEGELVSYEEAVPVILEMEAAARRVGVALKMSPDSGPPPCTFPLPSRVAHLYSMTPGARLRDDHAQLDACRACQMADRCSGLPRQYLARRAAPPMRPITEDRVRRRLSLISTVEDQIARELTQPSRYERPDTGVVDEEIIRVVFHCNQACRFCFVSTHLPPAQDEAVRRAIVDAGRAGKRIMLSGGEPTLNANLVEYVRLAKQHSRHPVGIQSNAIRLADAKLVEALVEAGMEEAFVSLHGSTAAISDAITEAPGTFDKTVVGVDNLHRMPQVFLLLNIVIHERNIEDLVPYMELVAARWPRAYVNISFVAASSDVVPKDRAMIPRYADVMPHLAAAVRVAKERDLAIGGFESMCGIPLCLVPAELTRFFSLTDIPEGYDRGEFVKTRACQQCDLRNKCYGLRRGYLDLYGDEELRPVHAGEARASG